MKLKIDKAAIDEAFREITDDMSEQDRDDLAKRAAKMAVLVKNPERVRAVVEHIVGHYQAKVEPNGFKAQEGSVRPTRSLDAAYTTFGARPAA